MNKKKNKKNTFNRAIKSTQFFLSLLLVCLLSLILILSYRLFPQTSNKKQVNQINTDQTENEHQTAVPPDFSNEKVRQRNEIDTSKWVVYKNTSIGFQLKYPPEWGKPISEWEECEDPDNCSDDNRPSRSFHISFPLSQFSVGGGSKNFTPHRGGNILYDFIGFSKGKWVGETLCQTRWFISCKQENDKMNYISIPACGGEPGSGFGYERVMLVDMPKNSKVGGLAFGGQFIPKNRQTDPIYKSCDERFTKSVGQAILDRKVDEETMRAFDVFEKVIETIKYE